MPAVESWLMSIEDAISCLSERASKGWPAEHAERVLAELSDIDARLWALCEGTED